MSSRFFKQARTVIAGVVLVTGLFSASFVWAHGGGSHTPGASTASRSKNRPIGAGMAGPRHDPQFRAPHGGQLSKTLSNYFEVVYGPRETRVYVYDMYRAPRSARGIEGWTMMRVRSTGGEFRYSMQYVPTSSGQDYLAIPVDLTRVHDGDMEVDYELNNVPSPITSSARFTQTFALTRPPVQVTVARLTEADWPLVERQSVCPVMDAGLSEHGEPIKLMVGNQALYVCCEGCIEDVEKNPRHYVQKAAANVQANRRPPRPQVAVLWASQSDDAAIRAQGICPVMDQALGGHGRPIKVVIDGQSVFVCCEGCIDKVVHNPGLYLSKIVRGQQPGQYTAQDDRAYPRPRAQVIGAGRSSCSSKDGSCCQ